CDATAGRGILDGHGGTTMRGLAVEERVKGRVRVHCVRRDEKGRPLRRRRGFLPGSATSVPSKIATVASLGDSLIRDVAPIQARRGVSAMPAATWAASWRRKSLKNRCLSADSPQLWGGATVA